MGMTHSEDFITDLESSISSLRSLQPGNSYTYFTGFLDYERLRNKHSNGCKLADQAYDLWLEGKVHLTQKRISDPIDQKTGLIDWSRGIGGGFEYIATGAHPDEKPKRSIVFSNRKPLSRMEITK